MPSFNLTRAIRVLEADGAQTDALIVEAAATQSISVKRITIVADGDNSVKTNVTVGFAAATLPTPVLTPATGDGILVDFPGVPAGGGVNVGDGSSAIGVGGQGEDLRYTCEAPTSGALSISVTYDLL